MAVLERAYAEPTQVNSSPPWRSAVNVGRIVAIAVKSSALSKFVTTMAEKDNQKSLPRDVSEKLDTSFTVAVEPELSLLLSCGTLFVYVPDAGRSTSGLAMKKEEERGEEEKRDEGREEERPKVNSDRERP